MADSVSDDDRKKLEDAITTALLLIYAGRAREALDRLGLIDREVVISEDATTRLSTFARERALLIQTGINQRLESVDDADDDQLVREIAAYNRDVLQPFLVSTASHQGLVDTYKSTPTDDPMAEASSQAQAHNWVWTQFSDNPDDCQEAAGMGPSPLDDLLAVTESIPPVHERCSCNLDPI